MFRWVSGQTVIEYVLLVTIITAALVYMFPMIKRGSQSLIKVTADQIGDQKNAEQDFNSGRGFTVGANYVTSSGTDELRQDRDSRTGYATSEWRGTLSNVLSNQGFTEE